MTAPVLPKRAPGRKTVATLAKERAADRALCDWVEDRWRDTGLAFGARGWGYVAEGEGSITKGQLDALEAWLGRVRKEGLLAPDAVSDDDSRAADHLEYLDEDGAPAFAEEVRGRAEAWLDAYTPVSFWDGLETYVETLVEKIDVKILFNAACRRYRVPLINGKGSTDINSRRRMLQRFRAHHEAGRKLVLLVAGDHDPAGLRISAEVKSNLMDCANIQDVQFDPSPIRVERIGLNADQIERLKLTWIDNLITSSGKNLADPKHKDHKKPYVQNYIRAHGIRKVEANALARNPAAAHAIIERAINQYVPPDWPDIHAARLAPYVAAARRAFATLIASEGE